MIQVADRNFFALTVCVCAALVLGATACDNKEVAIAVDEAKQVVALAPPPPGAHVLVVIDSSGSQSGVRTTEASLFIERLPAGSRVLVLDCDQTCRPIGPSEFLPKSRWQGLAGEQLQNIEAHGPSYPFEWVRVLAHLTRLAEPELKGLPAVAVAFTDGVATAGETRPEAFSEAALPLLEAAGLALVIADGDGNSDDVFAALGEADRVARISTQQTKGPEPLVSAVEAVARVVAGERPEPVIAMDELVGEDEPPDGQSEKSAKNEEDDEGDSNESEKAETPSKADADEQEEQETEKAAPSSQSGRGIGMMQVRQRAAKKAEVMKPDDPKSPFAGEVDPFASVEEQKDPENDGMTPLERIRKLVVNRQYDDARTELETRVEEHPDDAQAWLYLARLTAFTSSVEDGLVVLEDMVETLPDNGHASIVLADAYANDKQWPLRCAHLHRANVARAAQCRPKASADCPLASHLTIWGVEAKSAGLTRDADPTVQPMSADGLDDENAGQDFRARLETDSDRRALPIVMDNKGFFHVWRSPDHFDMRLKDGAVELTAKYLPERAYRLRVVPFQADDTATPSAGSLELQLSGESQTFEFELEASPVDVVDFTFEMPDFDDHISDSTPDAFEDWRLNTCAIGQ